MLLCIIVTSSYILMFLCLVLEMGKLMTVCKVRTMRVSSIPILTIPAPG